MTRILNINDSASNRYYVSRVLKSAGWEVLEASTGGSGLELARAALPDVVVLDIKLPDMSGLEVCRMLRADPRTADMLVIQTSATFVTSEGKARGLKSGADQYLTQPFESVELIAMVTNLLRLREKEREANEKNAALVEADKRKDEFLAMLAHELRNPLSAISVAAALLETKGDDPRTNRIASTIQRQTRHLARLVDDLLDVSRITRGKIQLRAQPIDLATTVRRFVESDENALARKGDLGLVVADEPMWIHGDPTRIDQILANLVGNAVRYTERGGRIVVSLTPGAHGDRKIVTLKVRDAGIGIAAENLTSVFDLFFQVDHSLARSQSGLGIGLTMVKRLVEMHGGSISVHSDGLGTGAEFRVELPAIAAPSAAPQPRAPDGDRTRLSLLLVDDNVDSCELYRFAFEDEGHLVETANDGARGLELLLTKDYDVALVDIGLPGVDGYEIARRACAARAESRPVLIALTGYGREEDRQRALDAGFDAHLVKPIDVSELRRIVKKQLAARYRGMAASRSAPKSDGHDGDASSA
ncbi:MAG: response regulator [Deltaproteobacteria bacterium]|nr:response regulator [Deltaproteobacteria bacterium]